jgi:hypothetical protein
MIIYVKSPINNKVKRIIYTITFKSINKFIPRISEFNSSLLTTPELKLFSTVDRQNKNISTTPTIKLNGDLFTAFIQFFANRRMFEEEYTAFCFQATAMTVISMTHLGKDEIGTYIPAVRTLSAISKIEQHNVCKLDTVKRAIQKGSLVELFEELHLASDYRHTKGDNHTICGTLNPCPFISIRNFEQQGKLSHGTSDPQTLYDYLVKIVEEESRSGTFPEVHEMNFKTATTLHNQLCDGKASPNDEQRKQILTSFYGDDCYITKLINANMINSEDNEIYQYREELIERKVTDYQFKI